MMHVVLFLAIQADLSKIDPELRRLSADAPVRAILRLAPGRRPPAIPGVTLGTRLGDVVTITTTAATLATMAAESSVLQIQRERCFRPCGDLSLATTVGARGEISGSGQIDAFTFAGVAGQTARIRAHAESTLDLQLSASDTATMGDDNGPGTDAELTVTWLSTGPKTINVSAAPGTGFYVLFMTVNGDATASNLTGSEITASNPAFVAGTRAREARAAFGVDGSGVVIGVIDTGVDHKHQDLRDGTGRTRLLAIWDQTLNPISGEASADVGFDGGTSNDYGVEYGETQINNDLSGATPGFVRQKDTDGHGSHVAGVAAGDDAAFPGAAPGARLIVVKTGFLESQIIDAIHYIFGKAERLGFKGIVINLSAGNQEGPHDGTGALDAAIDAAVGRGKYVVVSAGNDGDSATEVIHAQASIVTSTPVTWTMTPTSATTVPYLIDLWAHGSDRYTVTVTNAVTTSTTSTAVSGLTGVFGIPPADSITIQNRTDSPTNGATHILITITEAALDPYTITLTRTQTGGTGVVDGYIATVSGKFANANAPVLSDSSVAGTVSEPGTAKRAITVGAYRTKFAWDHPSGTTRKTGLAGQIAKFSSRGPTRDGRAKPDLAAPGAYLSATRSADATIANAENDMDGKHTYLEGTSVSAPVVTGILALLCQRNRILSPEEILSKLASTSAVDGMISLTVAQTFGAGKVDAMALLGVVSPQQDVKAEGQCLGSAVETDAPRWWPLAFLALLGFRKRRAWVLVLVLIGSSSVAAQEEVEPFARLHAGGWMSGAFEFRAIRSDGEREVDSRGVALAGVDVGARIDEHYAIFITAEGGMAEDLTITTLGGGVGYTHVIDDFVGPWPPSEVTVYFGAFWGHLEVDQENFGDFRDDVGYRAGLSAAFRPAEWIYVDLFLEYRHLSLDYESPILEGNDSIGGSGVAFGIGTEFRF